MRSLPETSGYCHYLTGQNMSSNTIAAYCFAVNQFFCFHEQLSFPNLQLYKVYLLEHYKPPTVNLRIRALNSYLEFLHSQEPRLTMVRIQQKPYLDRVISEGDYEYLKTCLLKEENYLYYFIIRFMAATGARISELVQLTVRDVRAGFRDIYSKDNKMRRLYIPACLQRDTLLWLDRINREQGLLFLNRFDQPITPGAVRTHLKRLALRFGIDPDVVYPHSFRHRFAKSFIERCSDIAMLSDLMGHESIETTRIYLRRSSSEQQQIIDRVVDW